VGSQDTKTDLIKRERDRYAQMTFAWADLAFELDRFFNIEFVEGPTEAFFDRSKKELQGSSFRDLVMPSDIPLVGQIFKSILKAGRIHDKKLRLLLHTDQPQWVSMSAYCLGDGSNIFLAMRKSSADELPSSSLPKDAQSGLVDGNSFSALAAERLRAIQEAGESAEVTLVSIPEITALQERLDAGASDALMQSVGDFLKTNSVGGDTAAKVGDGRFSIMHASGTKVEDLVSQIEGLTQKFDPTGVGVQVQSATMEMDASAGISEEDLAKGLLYTMNKFRDSDGAGLNIKDLTANMSTLVEQAVAEVNNFKQICEKGEFFVALQPIIHIATGEIHHYEALCRFDKTGVESPFKTITFAEETGLIHDFDFAMAKKVVEWLGKFPRNSNKYRAAVNVSGYSIGKPTYVEALHKMLKENEWLVGKLMFEITESSRMSDLDSANNFIQALRSKGYHVCLDDFGAGAASFQYLSVLDVDVVKLDGSAVKNAMKAPKGRAFLSALTELCKRMSVETIAEMVDTPETLEFCRDCNCNYVQGFLFGRPSKEVKDFNPLPQGNLFKKLTNLRY
jgi:EAL domain-containing protein (putative c-di-GMP-specific phosphodiesterase class I)/GGDEF domain-containing protein